MFVGLLPSEAEAGKAHKKKIPLYPWIPDSHICLLQAAEKQRKQSASPLFDCWAQ